MSIFDEASLVFIPSGYKTSKAYSVKPTSGDGDLTFTRSNDTATRVGPDGLIEKVRTNLFTYSEQFDNAAWAKTSVTVTANTTSNPNGLTTADTIAESAVANNFRINRNSNISITSGITYTASVFLKKGDGATAPNIMQLTFAGLEFGTSQYANFNINTGTIGTIGTGAVATIENYGSGWYRCSIKSSATATNASSIGLIVSFTNNNDALGRLPSYTGVATSNVFAWGAQAETGDIATDYIPTTTTAVSVGPVANLPRIDYTGGGCGKLLLEPQRTNSITSSESTATGWTFTNSSSAVNQTTSPDGYVNADSIIPNATSGQHAINSANITASGSFTLSAFVKAGEHTKVAIRESANTGSYASFNLATGTKIEDNVSGASFIQSYGNGWYRIGVTGTYSGTIRLGINVLSNAYTTGNPSSGTTFFSGNASDKLFCWGMQCELGATYASSYIPTLGSASTRGADSASKTGISSLIGSTEGAAYFAGKSISDIVDVSYNYALSLSDGTTSNRLEVRQSAYNLQFLWRVAGAYQGNILTSGISIGTSFKFILNYSAAEIGFFVNGIKVGTIVSPTLYSANTLTKLSYDDGTGAFAWQGENTQTLIFPTALTDAQCIELTTL